MRSALKALGTSRKSNRGCLKKHRIGITGGLQTNVLGFLTGIIFDYFFRLAPSNKRSVCEPDAKFKLHTHTRTILGPMIMAAGSSENLFTKLDLHCASAIFFCK